MGTESEKNGGPATRPPTHGPWGVRVRATGAGVATAYARAHSFTVGSALPFDLEEGRLTALEYLLGALGGDLIGGFRTLARRRRLAVDEVEATVAATLDNALTHLGVVGEAGHPGIDRIAIRVHIATFEPEDAVRAVWDEAVRRSPLMRTLAGAAAVEVSMTVTV